jgi:hypothetical protein
MSMFMQKKGLQHTQYIWRSISTPGPAIIHKRLSTGFRRRTRSFTQFYLEESLAKGALACNTTYVLDLSFSCFRRILFPRWAESRRMLYQALKNYCRTW